MLCKTCALNVHVSALDVHYYFPPVIHSMSTPVILRYTQKLCILHRMTDVHTTIVYHMDYSVKQKFFYFTVLVS